MAYRQITVAGGNLFAIAAQQLGDATQAPRIAALNGLSDFFLGAGVTTLLLPPIDANASGGVMEAATGSAAAFLRNGQAYLTDSSGGYLANESGLLILTG